MKHEFRAFGQEVCRQVFLSIYPISNATLDRSKDAVPLLHDTCLVPASFLCVSERTPCEAWQSSAL